MKKEIRLMLEYQCFPIWIYDENGHFIDNDLVEEIREDEKMISMLEELQDKFDSLYLNNKVEFKYVGFVLDEDRKEFEERVSHIYGNLCSLLDGKYDVKNLIDVHDM